MDRVENGADPRRRALLRMAAIAPLIAAGTARAGTRKAGSIAELPPALAEAVADYDQATFANDTETLGRIVADDYMLVNSDSTVQDKRSYLDDFRMPGFRLDPYVLREPVNKAWEDAALIGGLLPLRWTQDGARHSRLLRVVHLWVRPDERWQLAYTQLTRVPDAPPPT